MKKNRMLMIAILIFSQVLFACGILPKEEEFPAAPLVHEYEGADYGKTKVIKGDMVHSVKVTAGFKGAALHELEHTASYSYNRRVQKVHVEKGSKVNKGDTLLTYSYNALGTEGSEIIDYDTAVYEIKAAQTKLKNLRELLALEQKRLRALGANEKEIQLVREEYQASMREVESDLKVHEMEKKEAADMLKEKNLVSPVTGTVRYVKRNMTGKEAEPDGAVITVEEKSENRFEASTKYAGYFNEGEKLNLSVGDVIYPVKVKKDRKYKKRVYFYPLNKVNMKSSNKAGEVTCILQQKKNTLYLPSSVVYKVEDKYIVYIEDENGLKTTADVVKGAEFNHLTEIVSGLKEGDEVITN